MFDAFTVVLREAAELILIVGALIASLRSARAERLLPWVAAGTVLGCAFGIALSLWLISAAIDARWTAGLTFVLAAGVLLMVCTMLVGQGAIRSRTQAVKRVSNSSIISFSLPRAGLCRASSSTRRACQ